MTLSFYYIASGKMYHFDGERSTELISGVLTSYISNVRSTAERNEWKYTGSGAAFTGTYGQSASAEDAVSSIYSHANCIGEHNGSVIYSIDIDNTNGIYRMSEESRGEGIVLCSNSTAYRDFDIVGDMITASAAFAGESHIGVMDLSGTNFNTYTEGHTLDYSPVWSRSEQGKIYFCSAGLPEGDGRAREQESDAPKSISQMVNDMYAASSRTVKGPTAICLLDTSRGTLDEILTSDRYDYTHPESTLDGSLYYIRKPYKQESGGDGLGCLTDIIMFPVRIIQSIFGFLNVFSAKYSGKTLSHRDVKNRDEKQMFIDGNLINAERELRDSRRRGDKNPGIIPRSWELRRLDPNGDDTLVRAGVTAFKVLGDGEILVSNGSSILLIGKDGKEEKLLAAEGVVFIK